MKKLTAAFDWWVFDAYAISASSLAMSRGIYALFVLFVVAPGHLTNFAFISSFPDLFFDPPFGPMRAFDGFPPAYAFEAGNVLLNLSLVALLFGYRTRMASLITGLLFALGFGFYYSFGKINHNILFLVVPFVMAFSGWGNAYSYDAASGRSEEKPKAWPLALMALLIGFAMFTAGYAKLMGGWLDGNTQAVQGHVLRNVHALGRDSLLAALFAGFENALFWEALDWTTVFFEIGFLAAVLHPVSMRCFTAMAVLFHFGIMLVMNISFTTNLAAYAVLFRWRRLAPAVLPPFAKHVSAFLRRVPPAAALLPVASVFYFIGSPLALATSWQAFDDVNNASFVTLSVGAFLVTFFSAKRAVQALFGAPSKSPT